MKNTSLLASAVVLIVLAVSLDLIARSFFLYYTFVWFDLIVHFIASCGLGIAILWSLFFSSWAAREPDHDITLVFFSFTAVFLLGIFWEWFEYLKSDFQSGNYVIDTTLDLMMDAAGGLLAGWYTARWRKIRKMFSN